MAYGYQPTKDHKNPPPSVFNTGYVDVFATQLRGIAPGIQVVNYGCPGESLVTFTKGGCEWLSEGRRLHDAFSGSQLGAALAFLRANPGQVSPITITLWGNDIGDLEEACKGRSAVSESVLHAPSRGLAPVCVRSLFSSGRPLLRPRSSRPEPGTSRSVGSRGWRSCIDRSTSGSSVRRTARALASRTCAECSTRGSGFAKTRKRVCALTYVCSLGDVHPKDAGYRAMAKAFLKASGYAPTP